MLAFMSSETHQNTFVFQFCIVVTGQGVYTPTQCTTFYLPLVLVCWYHPMSHPQMEERIQCAKSGKVRYTKSEERVLRLPVPIEEASNLEAYLCWEKTKEDKQAKREKM